MKLKENEKIYNCLEFDNYYQLTIGPKKDEDKKIIGGCNFYAIKKDFSKQFKYQVPQDLDKVQKLFGSYVKELDEDEIEFVLKKVK